uniref:Serine/threonine protein kinase n=1 Tax=Clandestinovirus TaxID=2831644 RepID=A0A8F8PR07_9VIRU|nr:serine/threonine protein kinase [Clandestinovirus]
MNTTKEGCFSIVTISNSVAKKMFKYTSGYALKTEILNDGYEMVDGKSMESIICNEHAIHRFVSDKSKQTTFEGLFPRYIMVDDHLKMTCLLMSAADQSLAEVIMTSSRLLRLTEDIARALAFLHSNGICHSDIKPENVLWLKEEDRFQLADFGCASFEANHRQMYQDATNSVKLLLYCNDVHRLGMDKGMLITMFQRIYHANYRQNST